MASRTPRRARPGLFARMLGAVGLTRSDAGGAPLTRPAAAYYHGAVANRTTMDFLASRVSPDAAVFADLRSLRNRARTLERDNGWARRYVDLVEENLVGPDGYGLQIDTADGADAPDAGHDAAPGVADDVADDAAATLGEVVEAAWLEFTTREHCCVDGRRSFTDLEALAARRWQGADGEAFVQIVPGRGKFGVQFEPLDADLLDETFHRAASTAADGSRIHEIRAGVEVDAANRPVAYWFWTRHPDEAITGAGSAVRQARRRVPAAFVVHLYDEDRPGQTRGVTRFAPVVINTHRLGALQEAVLIQQHVAAGQGGWLKPTSDDAMPLLTAEEQAAGQQLTMEMEPGVWRTLPPGYTPEAVQPAMPGEQYTPFTTDVKHELAAGLGVSYMSLTGDLKGTSFSSGRMGLGPERRRWRRKQIQFRDGFHVPLFRAWLTYASLTGALPLAPRDLAAIAAAAEWLLPGWDYVDPTKDADAALTEVANTMNSLTAVMAAKGRDFRTVARQRARERRLLKRLGLPVDVTLTPQRAPDGVAADGSPSDPASDDA